MKLNNSALYFFVLFVVVSPVETKGLITDSLNAAHKFSHKKWRFQKELYSKFHEYPNGEVDRIPMSPRYGHYVEGVGEFADIASLHSTSTTFIRLANVVALVTRLADLLFGSFPEIPRVYMLSSDGGYTRCPSDDEDGVRVIEKHELRFWPHRWRVHCWRRNRDEYDRRHAGDQNIPFYLVLLAANQLSKVEGVVRAWKRIKYANILARSHRNLSKKQKRILLLDQFVQSILLFWGLYLKHTGQWTYIVDRYSALMKENIISMIRRYRMSKIENRLLGEAKADGGSSDA